MQPKRTPAPALPDEVLEDIFLRLPPDEPECLLRCSLASKLWLCRLTAPRFRTRYRDFHGAAPMLGFVYSWPPGSGPIFVSTTKFGPRYHPEDEGSDVLDCRHGRVLLRKKGVEQHMTLVVWDPMTGSRREMMIHTPKGDVHRAAVLCAEAGCDHRACHGGHFRVLLVALGKRDRYRVAQAYMSLPEVGHQDWHNKHHSDDLHLVDPWIDPCASLDLHTNYAFIEHTPPVFIAGALYFMLWNDHHNHIEILKYDIGSNLLSLLDVSPVGVHLGGAPILMAMEDGSFGLAYQDRLTLHLWSRLISSDGVVTWTQHRIIDLKEVLPIQIPEQTARLIGSVEGSDIIFVIADLGIYEINIKSLRQKKIGKRERLCTLIPYMTFHDSRGIFISDFFCDLKTSQSINVTVLVDQT